MTTIARGQAPFPASVVLVGRRQVRDYVLGTKDRKALSWFGSPHFTITGEATMLGPFTEVEVEKFLGQYTAATGRRMTTRRCNSSRVGPIPRRYAARCRPAEPDSSRTGQFTVARRAPIWAMATAKDGVVEFVKN